MSAINVYQQHPGNAAKAQSPLAHADLPSLVGKGRKNAGVTLREKKLLGHLTLRGNGHDRPLPVVYSRPSALSCQWP